MSKTKPRDTYLVAVDIGGTKTTVSISNKKGVLAKVYQPTKKQGDNKTVPRQVDSLIKYVCNQIKISKKQISSVGISTAGAFTKKGKHNVVVSNNICGGLQNQKIYQTTGKKYLLKKNYQKYIKN